MNKQGNARHRELCLLAAEWLRESRRCSYVAIELVAVTYSHEIPDVFGWDYWSNTLVEVKVSHSDFLADAKKPFRLHPEYGLGEFRYYFCPEGVIHEDEIRDKWGLVWIGEDGSITVKRIAERQPASATDEEALLKSVIRREIRPRIFDYRK